VDVPLPVILVVVAAFWVAVIASWFKRQAVAAKATENQKCPSCGSTHLSAEVDVVNTKSGEKVGLVGPTRPHDRRDR